MVGLLLGGALTEWVSWRWVLFVNAPIAVLVLLGSGVLPEGGRERGRLDLPGAITATLGVGSLVYALNRGSTNGWSDGQTIAMFILGAVLLIAFLLIERGTRTPLIPGGVVKDRNRGAANVVMFLMGAGMLAMFYFLTLYMQVVRGYSAMHTGLAYLPYVVGIVLAAGGAGPKLLSVTSPRFVISLGALLSCAGLVWYLALSPTSNYYAVLMPAMLIGGFGAGLTFVSSTVVGMFGVAPEDTGIAAGLVNTSQQLGGALGLAALASIASAVTRGKPATTAVPAALTDGYVAGFLVGAATFLAAALVAVFFVNAQMGPPPGAPVEAH